MKDMTNFWVSVGETWRFLFRVEKSSDWVELELVDHYDRVVCSPVGNTFPSSGVVVVCGFSGDRTRPHMAKHYLEWRFERSDFDSMVAPGEGSKKRKWDECAFLLLERSCSMFSVHFVVKASDDAFVLTNGVLRVHPNAEETTEWLGVLGRRAFCPLYFVLKTRAGSVSREEIQRVLEHNGRTHDLQVSRTPGDDCDLESWLVLRNKVNHFFPDTERLLSIPWVVSVTPHWEAK